MAHWLAASEGLFAWGLAFAGYAEGKKTNVVIKEVSAYLRARGVEGRENTRLAAKFALFAQDDKVRHEGDAVMHDWRECPGCPVPDCGPCDSLPGVPPRADCGMCQTRAEMGHSA